VPPLGYGGLEQVVADLAICLDRMGHEVYVFCPDESTIDSYGKITKVGCGPCSPNAREWEAKALELCSPIFLDQRFKDAILHCHMWTKPIYLLKQANPKLNVLSTLHGMLPYQSPPPVEKPCMVGISVHHAATIAKGLKIQTRHVYNGIDLGKYSYYSGERSDRFLFLARMTPFKGAHVFTEAMINMGVKGDLVGDDTMVEDKDFVLRLMMACDQYPNVTYWGGVDRDRTAKFFQQAKCYVLPCTNGWQEPFGLTVIEAMACGCPVVAAASGAIPELIVDGKTGYVVNDIQDLSSYLQDDKIGAIESSECRSRAEFFSRERMSEEYVKLYEECVNHGGW